MAFIDTPRTDVGNATFMTYAHNLDDMSMEKSFLSPAKKQDALLSQLRNNCGVNVKTPGIRAPLGNRRNLSTYRGSSEFTPLLKSATKRNAGFLGKENALPQTPAFLKAGYTTKDSPALRAHESSMVYGDDTGSSIDAPESGTPMPQVASSSAQSTPLAVLPKRNADGELVDQGNLLTLREQENIIDKVEKENFGLKLKIHFLEELLRKASPDFHQTALKENTELKVDKVTARKEISKVKKLLNQAEQDIETYKRMVEEAQEKSRQKHADQSLQNELKSLRRKLADKEVETGELKRRIEPQEGKDGEINRLRGNIEDLEADLRAKDREIEDKDDELEKLDERIAKFMDVEQQLASAKEEIGELQDLRETIRDLEDNVQQAKAEVEEIKEERDDIRQEKQKAVDDLDELRDEMSNKSFITKGLDRQIEEKANKLEDDLANLRSKYKEIEEQLDTKSLEVKRLHGAMQDAEVKEQISKHSIELLRKSHEIALRNCDSSTANVQNLAKELQIKTEEKNLLQSRHDALTHESQSLQRELNKALAKLSGFERDLQDERQNSLDNNRALKNEAKQELDRLMEELDSLRRILEDERSRSVSNDELWSSQRRELQLQKEKAEQKASGLQRTVDRLHQSEGTLSGRETKLQEALESEKQRHRDEDALFSTQINELQSEINNKRQIIDETRSEILKLKEELRVSERDHAAAEEKIQALEDEIDVLQSGLDEEAEAKIVVAGARQEVESLEHRLHGSEQQLSRTEEILERSKSERQTLQDQLTQTNIELHSLRKANESTEGDDISILRRDLSMSRKKEIDFLQREAASKENIRELKKEITRLENQMHQIQLSKFANDSPSSSAGGSARKNEANELRRQLSDAHQQIKELRVQAKKMERNVQRRNDSAEEAFGQQVEDLEMQIADLHGQHQGMQSQNEISEKTIERLRNRLQVLERDLHVARQNKSENQTIAEERKDLHDMLKDAKLELEELQVQISDRETRLEAASSREKDLRSQLTRIREERSHYVEKSTALSTELEKLQRRYERKIDEVAAQQQGWAEERRAIVSRVRFPNTSLSSLPANGDSSALRTLESEMQEKEKRHQSELKGLAKQIQCIKAKCMREARFRADLAHEKSFLLLQIEMFQACNAEDLRLLEEMGVVPDRQARKKRPSLRAVGYMVLAGVKMQRSAKEWAVQTKIQASLVKKAEQVRKSSRKSIVR